MLIHEWVHRLDEKQAAKACLLFAGRCLTYGEVALQTEQLAHRLAAVIKQGERVLVQKTDPIDQLLYFFAVIRAGGCCILIDAEASAAVCRELMERQGITCFLDKTYVLPLATVAQLPTVAASDYFLGALSSGSTGAPKVIWRDHASWTNSFDVQCEIFRVNGDDTLFIAGSLVYTANLNACVHMLVEGGTVVIGAGARPRGWLQEMTAQAVTAVSMVPAHYNMLLKTASEPLPFVRSLVAAGAKMSPDTVRRLKVRFPSAAIVAYYGASELGHVAYITGDELLKKPGAAGKLFPGVKVSFKDDEIWVQSDYLSPAYRPEGSAGDLGRLDEEGFLYVLGRKSGLINSGGIKIIPEQLESVLGECPGVEQAVVAGIADADKGERVCAWVVKKQDELTTADMLAFCRQKLRPHYWPQKIVFVEALPLNANGKIDRLRLLTDG